MCDTTQRFTGRAQAYDRYRQRYPASAVLQLLRDWCGLQAEWSIADAGAGTGMLSEVFLANGNRVFAIEPNADMRDACRQLQTKWPKLEVLDATAEATGLPARSVAAVSAGRAFHWFDTDRALTEFQRILKPGGWVILLSLGRAHSGSEQSAAFEGLLLERSTRHAEARTLLRMQDRLRELFPGELHHAEISGNQQYDWESLLGQTQSMSVVPRERDSGYEEFLQGLRRHFDRYAHDGVLTVETTCWVSAGRF